MSWHRFSYCQYPFILSIVAKKMLLQKDSEQQMILNARVRNFVSYILRAFFRFLEKAHNTSTLRLKSCLFSQDLWSLSIYFRQKTSVTEPVKISSLTSDQENVANPLTWGLHEESMTKVMFSFSFSFSVVKMFQLDISRGVSWTERFNDKSLTWMSFSSI
jgi:hypothetical protein